MIPTKQNLFLFFEENELKPIIDRKLVLLYANRCIIDEDAQFEICGAYMLQPVLDQMEDMLNGCSQKFRGFFLGEEDLR